jgi:Holliday junction resolvasome RuvABC ATP-dependent DNA helicase subunit
MRYFNTSGPNIIEKHYTLPRYELVESGIKKVIDERYFTIWAPRQTGKSTYFRLLADALKAQDYIVVHVNVEGKIGSTEEYLCHYISTRIENDLKQPFKAENVNILLEHISNFPKKTVFIIDEIEQVNPDIFNVFLHTIRAYYHDRSQHNLKSVVLVGVANITGIVQDNASPFNIADNFDIPYFTAQEVFELFAQHETESGQVFNDDVKTQIHHITAGQPGLVNGFGLKLSETNRTKPVIDYANYLRIEDWYLYEAIDKNISNIINKAKNEQKMIESLLFSETERRFDIDNQAHRYLYINGLIKRNEEGNVAFWVPLYKKRLQKYFYPQMNGEAEEIQQHIDFEDYYTPETGLNIDKIIRDYQIYAKRRGFRYFITYDANGLEKGLREAALVYSFETYIQSFLQVAEGKSYLEAHVALGRSDLIVNVANQEFVIEAKLFTDSTKFRKGKPQLAYYLKSLGLTEGIYLVFVKNTVTNPKIIESIEFFEDIKVSTYLVRYDMETDFV